MGTHWYFDIASAIANPSRIHPVSSGFHFRPSEIVISHVKQSTFSDLVHEACDLDQGSDTNECTCQWSAHAVRSCGDCQVLHRWENILKDQAIKSRKWNHMVPELEIPTSYEAPVQVDGE